MDDLISKTSVCEILAEIYPTDGEKVVAVKEIDKAYETILNLPYAERHGRWIENETSYADPPTKQTCNCSICGKASTRPLGDWCRWCGSRMDLDGDTE